MLVYLLGIIDFKGISMSKTVIIGGVAGGATAAARLRRLDENAEIEIFEQGSEISYANCGLPYYLGGVIKSRNALLLQDPIQFAKKFNLTVNVRHQVQAIDTTKKLIKVLNLNNGQNYNVAFDNLIIATGSTPIKPAVIPGIELPGIYTLWNMKDVDNLKEIITALKEEEQIVKPPKAVIVGGGFIGLELAENFKAQGIEVAIVERLDQIMATLDKDMADVIAVHMQEHGIDLRLNTEVLGFKKGDNKPIAVELKDKDAIEADIVILALGVKPNSKLAGDAGIELTKQGGIVTNSNMETSIKNIYAVGDVVAVNNPLTQNKVQIPLAGPANRQARICASAIAGVKVPGYAGTYGAGIAKVFSLAAGSVGLNEKQLQAMGQKADVDYFSVLIVQKSHAGYYPGAQNLFVKGIFNKKTGQVLGAQVIGKMSVDKTIDAIATAIFYKGTYEDLLSLELAYAPPFGSAKSVVNMLGFVAQNKAEGLVDFISAHKLLDLINSKDPNYGFIDVREPEENEVFSISGFRNIPLGEIRTSLTKLDKKLTYVVTCAVGVRAYNAARILKQAGFKTVVLSGGTLFFRAIAPIEAKKEEVSAPVAKSTTVESSAIELIDCTGLQCPGPIVQVKKAMQNLPIGKSIKVLASDEGFARDIRSFARMNGHKLNSVAVTDSGVEAILTKEALNNIATTSQTTNANKQTIVVFSDDLDKVLASLVIANGALAAGMEVTIFFTFWGLNVIKTKKSTNAKNTFMQSMFAKLMPSGIEKLRLSKFNFGGMGAFFMQKLMRQKNILSAKDMLFMAKANGAKFIACSMSMEIMGVEQKDLMDGVEISGVATYLEEASKGRNNLFI